MPGDWPKLEAAYLIVVNLLDFVLMWVDKGKAQRRRRRVPERTLFLFPLLGGALGGTAGMYAFRHKTRHWYFRLGFPALLVCQLLAAWALWRRFG